MSVNAATRWRVLIYVSILNLAGTVACVSAETDPSPRPAIEYVVRAFDRYPLVALSEWHSSRETKDFVGTLIRHGGFAGKVNDLVVEFGNARYQGGDRPLHCG